MKKIVLSGSMKFRKNIIEYGNILKSMGYDVIIPRECIDINLEKSIASKLHFDEITKADTEALLVINMDKSDNKNYIGANTFAEIAMAWYFKKKGFLLNGIYEPYKEELIAWGITALNGEFRNIKI